uniref:Lysozyme inhibitor LprI-like N-terminal domain-containing protein n=1 Tax=mine drainage metagenome TaxID=410659 RepID=E6PQA4_9ZZZZ
MQKSDMHMRKVKYFNQLLRLIMMNNQHGHFVKLKLLLRDVPRPAVIICLLLSLLMNFSLPEIALADQGSCKNAANDIDLSQCLGNQIIRLRRELNIYYKKTLKQTQKHNLFDTRKTQAQLEKSQAAWKIYVNVNCAYIGGLQGGSNLYVSIFEDQCIISSINSRIYFFRHLPTGG